MKFRVSADHAGASVREAAWGFEERVLWRGSDATRAALERASRRLQPLQRLVQTRLTWPLGDALRTRSRLTRSAVAASAAALALAAGAAGAITANDHPAPADGPALPAASVTAQPQGSPATSSEQVLEGVTPQFKPGPAAPPPSAPTAKPSTPVAEVAWQFAGAFVGYEVGRSTDKTDSVFAETATKPLVKSLAADPPRLPASGKVPRARVLNVVLGDATKNQVTASVSLVRLRAISEVRLTLTKTGDRWRVAQVLG
jgi:hypothetical protein